MITFSQHQISPAYLFPERPHFAIATFLAAGINRLALLLVGIVISSFASPVELSSVSLAAAEPEFPADWFFDGLEEMRAEVEGKPALAWTAETWIGDSVSLDSARGKVVVLDFWATWCGPCVASIPKNNALVDAHPDDLVFIGMHTATSGWDSAEQTVKDREINYPVALDTGDTEAAYGISAFPTYVIIDRNGIVRAAGVAPTHVKDVVEKLLEESRPAMKGLQLASFDREWFYSGAQQMRPWLEQLGQAADPIEASAWWSPDASDADAATGPENEESEVARSEVEEVQVPDGMSAADLKGTVRVLHFTRPGISVTQQQLKRLNEAATKYIPQGVSFAVVCDHDCDWNETQSLARELGLKIPMALDAAAEVSADEVDLGNVDSGNAADGSDVTDRPREAGRTAQQYNVRIAPVTVLIDRKGRIRATGLNLEQLEQALDVLLSEQAG